MRRTGAKGLGGAGARRWVAAQGTQGLRKHDNGVPHYPPQGSAFRMPPKSITGSGALQRAGEDMKASGFKKVLIVTDQEEDAVQTLVDALEKNGIAHSQVVGTAAKMDVDGCDGIVSLGGGSPHEGGDRIPPGKGIGVPLVCINTGGVDLGAGTPDLAVQDPELAMSMPTGVTASAGMDALCVATEAYLSTLSNPVTDACALHAIRLIFTYLRPASSGMACEDHDDVCQRKTDNHMKAHDMLSYAEYLAGMALNSSSTGYVTCMANQVSELCDIPQREAKAVLLPVVMEYNAKHVPELFVDLSKAMGLNCGDNLKERVVLLVLAGIKKLGRDIGMPQNLRDLGARREDLEAMVAGTIRDAGSMDTSPHQPTSEEVLQMFEQAYAQAY